jgi:hypothetical protein
LPGWNNVEPEGPERALFGTWYLFEKPKAAIQNEDHMLTNLEEVRIEDLPTGHLSKCKRSSFEVD